MLPSFQESLEQNLHQRREDGLFRRRPIIGSPQGPGILADGKQALSFCSNDYLGLANHPELKQAFKEAVEEYGVGTGASHLVSGHTRAHHALEEELAAFTGRSRALLFSCGYMANVGVITTLLAKGDSVFEDRLNHASLLDGGVYSRAQFHRYPHRDYASLDKKLSAETSHRRRLVVTDGVFSMDGDLADLSQLIDICGRHEALLMVDDAHGFGCLGDDGSGTIGLYKERGLEITQNNCQVLVGTLGKAFGTAGAFVAGSDQLIETLIQYCRPYIYTTAMPAALAQATRAALQLLRNESWRRDKLRDYISRFRTHCRELGLTLTDSISPIQGVIFGDVEKTMAASRILSDAGIFVTAIRPPTVPRGSARLRVTFSAAHTEADFQQLLAAMKQLVSLGTG